MSSIERIRTALRERLRSIVPETGDEYKQAIREIAGELGVPVNDVEKVYTDMILHEYIRV